MDWPLTGDAGLTVNDAVGAPVRTVTFCVVTFAVAAVVVDHPQADRIGARPRERLRRRRPRAVGEVGVASPSRSHAWLAIVPSGSLEVEVSVIAWPLSGDAGLTVNDAVGARFSTVTVFVAVAWLLPLSVTLRRTVYVPGADHDLVAVRPAPSSYWPSSSRSQARR